MAKLSKNTWYVDALLIKVGLYLISPNLKYRILIRVTGLMSHLSATFSYNRRKCRSPSV